MTAFSSEVSAPSSTPAPSSDNATFSDAPTRAGTPPSSPPAFPWELQDGSAKRDDGKPEGSSGISTTKAESVKNVFSVLGKRKPLETVSDNARPRKQQKPTDAKPLTQMQMSLGQKIQTKCKLCGMEYVASSAEDRKLHDKFHKQNTEGYDVGKEFVAKTMKTRRFKGVKDEDAIVLLDCTEPWHRKNRGQSALEIVQRELGAVPIPQEDIWDSKKNMRDHEPGEAKFKAYLYVRGTKCIGFLLVEKIQNAFLVMKPEERTTSRVEETEKPRSKNALEALRARKKAAEEAHETTQRELEEASNHPIELSNTKSCAVMGISRIWTSSTHRHQSIALCLLNTAVNHNNWCYARDVKAYEELPEEAKHLPPKEDQTKLFVAESFNRSQKISRKDQVAFSQPTTSGAKLARKWFGKAYGWAVYMD